MKKSISYIALTFIMLAFAIPSFSTIHTVLVGSYYFNPQVLNNVNTGDTIRWQWVNGSHTTTSASIPGGAASWDSPITSSNQSFDYIPLVTGTYNYVCTPHASMGQTGSFTVVSAPAPLGVTASADEDNICKGQSTTLHATPSGGTGTYSYSWVSNPQGFTSNQQNVQVTPQIPAVYTVTVTSGTQTASSSVSVTVNQPPTANAGIDTSFCADVTQIPVEGTASFYSSITWTTTGDGSFTSPNSLTGFYVPGSSDKTSPSVDLVLAVNAQLPCTGIVRDTVHIILDPCTGIFESASKNNLLSISPNPSDGQFTVSGLNSEGKIMLYDLTGKVIESGNVSENQGSMTFSVKNTSGLIFVKFVSGSSIKTGKVVIR